MTSNRFILQQLQHAMTAHMYRSAKALMAAIDVPMAAGRVFV
jgi:hypothetical protein